MKYGYYADRELPEGHYRCPSWDPMPAGKKNVVVLGCSHTYGEGLEDNEHWVHFLSQHNTERLRYWNLGQPGASCDKVVRILYGCEKLIDPRIIIVCWPFWSRRERLGEIPTNIISTDTALKNEDEHTDKNNFLKNVFLVQKYADKNDCTVFHCFAQENYSEHIQDLNVLPEHTIKNCYPPYDKHHLAGARRTLISEPSLAKDGVHYGVEHHKEFAKLFLGQFAGKLK